MDVFKTNFVDYYIETMGTWSKDNLWDFISRLVRKELPAAESWLDLCCGNGSLLRLITDAGYKGTGVDLSADQLKHARKNVPIATLKKANVCTVKLGHQFDMVSSTFSSLDYLTRKKDLTNAFRTARRHLKPDGLFIFDISTYQGFCHAAGSTVTHKPDSTIIMELSFNERTSLRHVLFTFFPKARNGYYEKQQEEHIQRAYHQPEIAEMLTAAGLSFRVLDGSTFTRLTKISTRALYVCRHARPQKK